jgi:DNA polymerase-1
MPATLPPPGAEGVLYLVDLSGYVFRAYHAIAPLSSSKGEPTHAVLGTVNMLQKVVNEKRPHMLAVAMDSRGPTFRKAIDARYKATRVAPPPDLSQQMARCEEIVRAYHIPVYQENGIEADDLIAAVVLRAMQSGGADRIVIVSADKDLMQLVRDDDDRVVLWDSMRDRVYGPEEVRAKFGVAASRVRDFLALTGDTSDNVPGVPSVGPKTASDLLNEYGTLDGIYENIAKVKRPKLREALTTHEADARISQRLVTLKADAEVKWDPEHLRYGGADVEALRTLFLDLEFHRLLDLISPKSGAATPVARAGASSSSAGAGESAAPPITRTYACVTDQSALAKLVADARRRGVVALQAETAGDDPMRAALIGLSLASAPGEGFYIPLAHRYLGCPPQLTWATVKEHVGPLFADAHVKKVAHDMKREEITLSRFGITFDGPIFDTMLASYLLDPEAPLGLKELSRRELNVTTVTYEEATSKQRGSQLDFDGVALERATDYAAASAEITVTLAERFEPRIEQEGLLPLMHDVELPLSRVLATMEATGVLVDVAFLGEVGKRVESDLRRIEAQCKEIAGRDFSVRSRDQLEKILFDELKLPVIKKTPKGGRSTDAEVLEELADKHALPKQILEFRELDKLKGTYIDALPKAVNPDTGRVHTRFSQTTAATGRLASVDPNLQNIPIRTEVGREIRAAFVAPPGHVIVSADYSQIELRVLAHLSQDPELIDAFRSRDDVHARTAALVFDVAKDAVTDEQRRMAKMVNFGVIYGMTDGGLAKRLGISRDEAARFIDAYFRRYAGVARFMEKTVESARHGEAVRTLLGRRRFLPNLHSANRGLRFEAERIAKNTPIQGTAADILKVAMVNLGSREIAPGVKMVLTVHDELVFEVPAANADDLANVKKRIAEEMSGAMKLDVPLDVDVGHGDNWAKAH